MRRLRDKRLRVKPRIVKQLNYWWADRLNPATGNAQSSSPGTFQEALAQAQKWIKETSC